MRDTNNVEFNSGPLSITSTMLRFRGRRYKLRHIENMILKRPLFIIGLALGALLIGFVILNADLLFWHEMAIAVFVAPIAPLITWPFGTLQIQSRTLSVDGSTITWFHHDLARIQTIFEETVQPHGNVGVP